VKLTTSCADISWLDKEMRILLIEFFFLDVDTPTVQAHLQQIHEYFIQNEDNQLVYSLATTKAGTTATKMSKEARTYLASDIIKQTFKASAILVHNPVMRLLGNIYMTVGKPVIPTKIFKDKEKAIEWLKQF